ncbi:DNA-binding capsular synthesis response regulator RcsB [Klebsiella pneumoniae]|nr:DNA-binding capsular synthesis response regulator RcsB [Klebsiella pneumoniae]
MNTMNVIIADDHPIVLFGIRKSLEQIEWVNVVGEFEDSTALINNLPKLDAHVLITDLSMPGDKYGDGITLIKYIKRHFPDLSIIVLTMNNNPAILSAVLDLDIEGIVLKQGAPTDLPKALAALQKGKKFTPESVSRLLEKISASGYGDKRLSPKESEVLRLFAEGFLVTEIAKKLNRSIKTISSQKKSAMMKLGRRKRHRLAELPLFRLAERDGQRVISSPSPSRPGETELPIIPALYAPAPHIPSAFASVRRG